MPGMDAEKRRLRAGDVLVSVNGKPIRPVQAARSDPREQRQPGSSWSTSATGKQLTVAVKPAYSTADGSGAG